MSRPSQMTVRYQVPVEGGIREFRTIAGARSYAQQNNLKEIRDVYRGKQVPITAYGLVADDCPKHLLHVAKKEPRGRSHHPF
jgi:hypothetical protein